MPAPFASARAGRIHRLVIGADRFDTPAFFAPRAPVFQAGSGSATVDGEGFRVLGDDGAVLLRGKARPALDGPWALDIDLDGAAVWGLGAHTGTPTKNDKRFRVMTLDTMFYGIEGASYSAMPFLLLRGAHGRTTGVLVATTWPFDVDTRGGRAQLRMVADAPGELVDLLVFQGTPAEIACDLASVVGTSFLPPAWALGFHQSRWSYKTADEVLEVARRFRKEELPADVIHLDIHYMQDFCVHTFHKERFPDPRAMHDELARLGFRTLAIVDPGVSKVPYACFDEGTRRDAWMKRADGTPYEGKVWPGATVFPDFTLERARAFWAEQHKTLVDAGVGGVWNDMNDPVLQVGRLYDPLHEDVRFADAPQAKLRNLYANLMAESTVRGLRALRPDERPFVLTRSAFLGIQRHSAVWTGDNVSRWRDLRENVHMVVGLGLSGVPLTGADVGGFGGRSGLLGVAKLRPPAELFSRWMDLGSFMPFFRVHCVYYAPRQEPWSFGKQVLATSRRALRRRYRLLPYLYRLALEAATTGMPLVRPLWMHHDVPAGVGDDQFLLGDALLCAPVLDKGRRKQRVYLPPGAWIDVDTGAVHKGDTTIEVEAPLGTIPHFLRAGAAMFWGTPTAKNAHDVLHGPIALEITTPLAGTTGTGSLFLDDGVDPRALDGHLLLLDVEVKDLGGRLEVSLLRRADGHRPPQPHLTLWAPPAFSTAVIDDKERVPLVRRRLVDHDRQVEVAEGAVPWSARRVVLE